MATAFRNSAGFGKRIEYWIMGRMLMEGLDIYVPLVDDDAIDVVIRKADNTFTTVQIKATSKTCKLGNAGLFAAIPHELRENYWFIFYSERMDRTWVMSSKEFLANGNRNKTGVNAGKNSIWFNGFKKNKLTGESEEYCHPRFEKFLATDFSRLNF